MKRFLLGFFLSAAIGQQSHLFAQGSLIPPGGPGPTMKTLDQVEPRIPIDAIHTPGDSTHLFVISAPGSYYLTGNLSGVSGKSGIWVNSNNVTVDLNGFALLGVGGSLAGITDGGNIHGSLAIRHGSIISWAGAGLDIAQYYDSVLADLIVTNNGGTGMSMGDACVARDCVSRDNTGDNIVTSFHASLRNCIAVGSVNGNGVTLGQNSSLTDCTANFNKLAGIQANANCAIAKCSAHNNMGRGISAGDAAVIANCSARNNGSDNIFTFFNSQVSHCTAESSTNGHGINLGQNSSLTDSTANFNKLSGVNAGPNCTIASSAANQNQSHGFALGLSDTVTACTANQNTLNGFEASSRDHLTACTASSNQQSGIHGTAAPVITECFADGNAQCGILVDAGGAAEIRNNVCAENGTAPGVLGAGIRVTTGSGCRIEGNSATFNYRGFDVLVVRNIILSNRAAYNSNADYNVVPGNAYGPLINVAGVNDISATAGANHPFANFRY